MKEKIYVYRIYFPESDKCYIGQTDNIERRMFEHLKADSLVGRAFRKYGDFKISVLHTCYARDEASRIEIEEIRNFNSVSPGGYNLTYGGEGGDTFSGRTHTKESKAKMSESQKGIKKPGVSRALKGKTLSPEHVEKIRQASTGRTHSEEAIDKIRVWHNEPENKASHAANVSKALKGVLKSEKEAERLRNLRKGTTLSPEHIEAIRQANTGRTMSEEHRAKLIEINTGKIVSKETLYKMSEAAKRRPPREQTEETKDKIRHALIGRKHTDESLAKMSQAKLGKKMSEEFCKNRSEHMKSDSNPMSNPIFRMKATYVKKLRAMKRLVAELPDEILSAIDECGNMLLELEGCVKEVV